MAVPAQAAVEGAEKRLLAIAAVFDEPVAPEVYPLTLLVLGHRSRTLYQAFLELLAGAVPIAARALVRPMLEINILVRFLRKDPDLHTELWQAEADRNTVTMAEEVRSSPHLRDRPDVGKLDEAEFEQRRQTVDEARQRALDAGLSVGSRVLPSVVGQLKVIDEPPAWVAYMTAYRVASWDVHTGSRAFLAGTFSPRNDGSVSYGEHPSPENVLSTRALAVGIVASTIQLIAGELSLGAIEQEAADIVTVVMEIPPQGDVATES
jgi:hypothetical protein